jgi:transposase
VFAEEHVLLTTLNSSEAKAKGWELYYFDESGFSLHPVVPYAWQPKGQTIRIPSTASPRLNVLGFFSKTQPAFFQQTEKTVNSQTVVAAFNAFAQQQNDEKTWRIVVMDNAPIHHSRAFQDCIKDWMLKRVWIHYLPAYCPELNLIEILWRRIKHQWLPLASYSNLSTLRENITYILQNIGQKYKLTFA